MFPCPGVECLWSQADFVREKEGKEKTEREKEGKRKSERKRE